MRYQPSSRPENVFFLNTIEQNVMSLMTTIHCLLKNEYLIDVQTAHFGT